MTRLITTVCALLWAFWPQEVSVAVPKPVWMLYGSVTCASVPHTLVLSGIQAARGDHRVLGVFEDRLDSDYPYHCGWYEIPIRISDYKAGEERFARNGYIAVAITSKAQIFMMYPPIEKNVETWRREHALKIEIRQPSIRQLIRN